jgi:hypothetical protein
MWYERDLRCSIPVHTNVGRAGASGHGKSLLASKCMAYYSISNSGAQTDFDPVGSLLDVPTHTVNMTTLRSTHDLWQSFSMSPCEVNHALVLYP